MASSIKPDVESDLLGPSMDKSVTAASTTKDTSRPSTPRLTFTSPNDLDRQPSIQFAERTSESGPTGSPKLGRPRSTRRMSSPPPPDTFQSRVSFDTFDNKDATDFSLTLNSKHKDYQYTRRSRTFLCGTDQNDYSDFALEWLIEELVDDGDEIVCLRVVDKDAKISSDASVEGGRYRTEAKHLLDQIIEKNKNSEERAISLVLEFAVGKVHDTIQRMIHIYEPAMLIVGTRGRSLGGIQGLLPGSVSKYCLQHSPVPVIVVRPTYKRERKKKKRQADPSRKNYLDILQKSGTQGTHALDPNNKDAVPGDLTLTPLEKEAEAVAAAIGLPVAGADQTSDMQTLSKVQSIQSTRSDATSYESPSPTEDVLFNDPKSPRMITTSPSLGNTDSPAGSDTDSSDDSDRQASKAANASGSLIKSAGNRGDTAYPSRPRNEPSGNDHEDGDRSHLASS